MYIYSLLFFVFLGEPTDASTLFRFFVSGEIKHDDKLTEEDGVYVQAAVLFTSCSGQRRLRILNLALNCGSSMAEMYRNCK